jgi:type I restriction enzyme S subunit
MTPLFTVARERHVSNRGNLESNVLSLSYGRIIRRDISENFGLLPESFETYQIVAGGNIVLRLTDLQNDKKSLRVGLATERGIITSAYVSLSVMGQLAPSFAFYLLHAYDVTKVFYALGGGVRQTMKFEDLKWIPMVVPDHDEQRAIGAFIDRETARIDGLVAKKEQLLNLLQEQRATLISRAVTKGLDPNAAVKDSGVEWLGEIPAHWKTFSLRRVIGRIEQGWSPVAEDRAAGLDEWAVIKLSAVNLGRFLPGEHKALPIQLAPDTRYEIAEGDFLLTRANTPGLVGDVCVVHGVRPKLMLCDLVYRVKLRDDHVCRTFLAYWLMSRAGRYQIRADARGASLSMVKISQSHIRGWKLVLPPHQEQCSIAAFLDRETARIDALVLKVREAIDRLKELRIALISAAVTGKIDVREEIS